MNSLVRPRILVDEHGFALRDPTDGSRVGRDVEIPPGRVTPGQSRGRVIIAAPLGAGGSSLARYQPGKPSSESCPFGMDYSFIVPVSAGIVSGALDIFTNTASPAAADGDWTKGPVAVMGRALFATLSGGVTGKDYQLRWTAADTQGSVWTRTGLVLCTLAS